MQAHARGEVLRESWTLYPKGTPVTSILVSRGLLLPDATQALLFVSERLPAHVAPDTLRGVEAIAHTTVRITLHSLPGGSVLMRNPAAAQAFGPVPAFPGKVQRDFESMFCEPGVAARIVAQVRRGQTFGAELELLTLQGLRWHAVDVRPVLDPVSGDKAMQFNARDIGDLKAVQRALELARTTADNAKAGQMMLSLDAFSLSQCITEALSPLLLAASDRNLKLTWQVADGVPDRLIGDSVRLRQVLINLVGNALKFTHSGEVRVEVAPALAESTTLPSADPFETPAPTLRFSVHDTGIGLSPGEIARIFEPFAQADASITRRYGGTGLGLTIVARLVKLMGAEMQVTSTPGEGSCFAFAMPLLPA
ncbi:MAG: hypothetical protein H7306_15620 [Bacteriovorax sp.]|nr:hypothetical protein [Rhizobacter sp.]